MPRLEKYLPSPGERIIRPEVYPGVIGAPEEITPGMAGDVEDLLGIKESKLNKFFNFINTPLFFTAGVVSEAIGRQRGEDTGMGLIEAGKNAVKYRMSYTDLLGINPVAGFALDIALDPLNLLPVVGWGGKIGKALAKIKPIGEGARVMRSQSWKGYHWLTSKPGLSGVRAFEHSIKTMFRKDYRLIHHAVENEDSDMLRKILSDTRDKYAGVSRRLGQDVEEYMMKRLPSPEGQAKIFKLLESRHLDPREAMEMMGMSPDAQIDIMHFIKALPGRDAAIAKRQGLSGAFSGVDLWKGLDEAGEMKSFVTKEALLNDVTASDIATVMHLSQNSILKVAKNIPSVVEDGDVASHVGEFIYRYSQFFKDELKNIKEHSVQRAALSAAEREAYDFGRYVLREITQARLLSGQLNGDIVGNFLRKYGIAYVPHMHGQRDHLLEQMRSLEKSMMEGEIVAFGSYNNLDTLRLDIKMLERIPTAFSLEEYMTKLSTASGKIAKKRGFQYERDVSKAGTAVADTEAIAEVAQEFHKSLPDVLAFSRMQSYSDLVSTRYLGRLSQWAEDMGMIFDKTETAVRGSDPLAVPSLVILNQVIKNPEVMVAFRELSDFVSRGIASTLGFEMTTKSTRSKIYTDFVRDFLEKGGNLRNIKARRDLISKTIDEDVFSNIIQYGDMLGKSYNNVVKEAEKISKAAMKLPEDEALQKALQTKLGERESIHKSIQAFRDRIGAHGIGKFNFNINKNKIANWNLDINRAGYDKFLRNISSEFDFELVSKAKEVFAKLPVDSAEYKQIYQLLTNQGVKSGSYRQIRVESNAPENVKRFFEGKMAPADYADHIEQIIKFYDPGNEQYVNSFLRGYRRILGMWKRLTLTPIPAYHTRNFLSNWWNNYLAGMTPFEMGRYQGRGLHLLKSMKNAVWSEEEMAGGGEKFIRKVKFGDGSVRDLTKKQFRDLLRDKRVIDSGELFSETQRTELVEQGLSQFLSNFQPISRAESFAQNVGRYNEDSARLAHFLWRLQKGDTVDAAVQSVHKYLFDYRYGLTDFESSWLRNGLIPFWAWTRFNMPLQLEMLARKPFKYSQFATAKRTYEENFGGPEPEDIFMDMYTRGNSNVRLSYDATTGSYNVMLLDSYVPLADIGRILDVTDIRGNRGKALFDEVMAMTSPVVKAPIELIANYNLFRESKIESFPGEKRRGLGFPVGPRLDHLLRHLRPLAEIDRITASASRQYLSDRSFLGLPPGYVSGVGSAIKSLFIGSTYPMDVELQRRRFIGAYSRSLLEISARKKALARRMEAQGGREIGPEMRLNYQQLSRLEETMRALKKELEKAPAMKGQ